MSSQYVSVDHAVLKSGTALGGAGAAHALAGTEIAVKTQIGLSLSTWADVAAFLAAVYSAVLLLEWLWKRVGRPFAERRGWVARLKRRSYDAGQE